MRLITFLSVYLPLAIASPLKERTVPTVQLDLATVVGSSTGIVDSFKGIPFAQPPVGQLRLKPPQPISSNLGTVISNPVPRACPQFYVQVNTTSLAQNVIGELIDTGIGQAVTDSGEDCLTLNVQRPSTATANSSLPVVFWIFGGGFEFGSTQIYDGTSLLTTSIAQKQPVIYVSVNYRVGGFGFLPGKEIKADGSANLGLLDQRLGLQWVADNIAKFGGDPSKVTIWGESAGSISVFDQMALYNGNNLYKGKPLFRAGIMDSGSITPANPVDGPRAQKVFDNVVSNAGCSSASDKLACLRALPYTTYLNAVNSLPGIFGYDGIALSYLPRPDGKVLTQSPEILVQNGNYAKVPFIIGDQEDEGTIFSLTQSNISTNADLVNYLSTVVFQNATTAQVSELVSLYPDDPSAGSPFRTGALNNIYPQYKRLAALQGDFVFTLTRRIFLNLVAASAPKPNTWSYLASYLHGTPVLGTFHASDILQAYGITPGVPQTTIQSYYISFINTLNPNSAETTAIGLPNWPLWGGGKQLMNFQALTNVLLADDFRSAAFNYLSSNAGSFRI